MRGRRNNSIALAALAAIVLCSAVTAGLVHSSRPELHVTSPHFTIREVIGPFSIDPTPPATTTTTEPPVTTTTTEAPPPPAPVEQRAAAPALPDAGSGECANPVVPEAVARRESGCRWDAYNPTGCSGRGCIGFYQLDEGHFRAVSPWNPNVSGVCFGLDPSTREGQTECASRLGPGAWN